MGFRFVQANLQHVEAASKDLTNRFKTEYIDISFIQAPYQYNEQITTLTGKLVYGAKLEKNVIYNTLNSTAKTGR